MEKNNKRPLNACTHSQHNANVLTSERFLSVFGENKPDFSITTLKKKAIQINFWTK